MNFSKRRNLHVDLTLDRNYLDLSYFLKALYDSVSPIAKLRVIKHSK